MSFSESGDSFCPVAQTLAIVGERWTFLLLREMFMGSTRFDEFQMYTEISPHLLSLRLKMLEANGLIRRKQYSETPARFEYRLTSKGVDLFPVIVSLKAFGEKHADRQPKGGPALNMIHKSCGHATRLRLHCSCCEEAYGPRDIVTALGPEFAKEREERKAAFIEKQRNKGKSPLSV